MKAASLIMMLYVCCCLPVVYGQAGQGTLSPKQQARAEHLVLNLEELGKIAAANPPFEDYRSNFQRLTRGVGEEARKFPESGMRTDLLTALRLYERVLTEWQATTAPLKSGCADERPGLDLLLCENIVGPGRELLWRKANRRVEWARAALQSERGERSEALENSLRETRAERKLDVMLAQRAIESVRELEREVFVYDSLAEFEEGRALARVSFESFAEHLDRITPLVKRLLVWLPESGLKSEIRNALLAYMDGRFWWSKVHRPGVVNAASMRFTQSVEPTRLEKAYLTTDLYTVVINWRQGRLHLKRATELLSAGS